MGKEKMKKCYNQELKKHVESVAGRNDPAIESTHFRPDASQVSIKQKEWYKISVPDKHHQESQSSRNFGTPSEHSAGAIQEVFHSLVNTRVVSNGLRKTWQDMR